MYIQDPLVSMPFARKSYLFAGRFFGILGRGFIQTWLNIDMLFVVDYYCVSTLPETFANKMQKHFQLLCKTTLLG